MKFYYLLLALSIGLQSTAQNVLIVLADDIGVERLSCYGESAANAKTPTLDLMARAGTVVDTAYAFPVCSPTRASLLTGRYPFRHDVGDIFKGSGNQFLPGSEILIPEAAEDVASGIFGKWHLADANPLFAGLPIAQGFDHFEGTLTSHSGSPGNTYYDWTKITSSKNGQGQTVSVTEQVGTYATTETTNNLIDWIGQQSGQWFAFASFHSPHPPYHVPPTSLHSVPLSGSPGDSPGAHHRAAVEALDSELFRLFSSIDMSNTLVVFVGDNGTPAAAAESPVSMDHAKTTLYEGGIHVPMIFYGPGVRRTRMQGLVSVVDLFPTTLEFLGSMPPESDGVSLLTALQTGVPSARSVLFSERFKSTMLGLSPFFAEEAARDCRYKLIIRHLPVQETEFYDLHADPYETENLLSGTLSVVEQNAHNELMEALASLGKL